MPENTWAYFWTYYTDELPAGGGFGLYSPAHLIFLAAIAAFCVLMCLWHRRLAPRGQAALGRAVTFAAAGLELAKQVLIFATLPAYPPNQLPLHLCGMSIIIEAIHALKPNKTTGEIVYCLSLPGALAALLFADWAMYPLLNFYCLQSFLIHALQIAFPIMLLASGKLRPNWRQLWRPALFLLVVAPPIFFLNRALGTNFMFLAQPTAGSPLVPLEQWLGNPGYLFGFAGLVAVIWVLMYLPLVTTEMLKKLNKKNTV